MDFRSNEPQILLDDKYSIQGQIYEYSSIGCQLSHPEVPGRDPVGHDFSILRDENQFFEVSDEYFNQISWQQGIKTAEVFAYLFILRRK